MARPSLDRRLGPIDAAAIIVSNVIGSGIFLTPAVVAALMGDPMGDGRRLARSADSIAFAGAMAYAELAALRPHAGGEYVYLREAFGPVAAFLTGWTSFVAGFSGADRRQRRGVRRLSRTIRSRRRRHAPLLDGASTRPDARSP